ncbi:MAG TPA: cytochrome c [Bryobacteraceae bacterium]|nr:cytochrome c [Bryobacteraceae bacterium]
MKITICAVLFSTTLLSAQSVWDGVYTQAQADRGKAVYAKSCAACHGATLDGSGAAPPLAGADFRGEWNGKTAADLYDKTQTTMPADQPGTLTPAQTSDILAFLFASNGFPAGSKDLPADAAALAKIPIEAAKK